MNHDEWRNALAQIATDPESSDRVRLDALLTLGRDRGWILKPRRSVLLRLLDKLIPEEERE